MIVNKLIIVFDILNKIDKIFSKIENNNFNTNYFFFFYFFFFFFYFFFLIH